MARLCVAFLVLTDRKPTCPARNSTQQLLVSAGETSVLLKRQRRQSHILPTTTIFGNVQGTWRDCLRIPWRRQLEPIPHWVADGPCSKMLADKHANASTPESRPSDSARAYWTITRRHCSSRDADVGRGNREVTFRGGTVHRSKLEHNSSRLVSRPTP